MYFKATPLYSCRQTAGVAMPREDRRISFDFTETYKVIFALCVQKEMPRPVAGSITAIDFKGDDGRCVAVRFANGLQGTLATSEYGQDCLGVLSVRTCGLVDPEIPRRAVLKKQIASGYAVIQEQSAIQR